MGKMGYTVILEWMYPLKLKLAETICLAVIYGFSQDGESTFKGSRKYLAERMCVKDIKTVDRALMTLSKLNLVERIRIERSGVKFYEYKVTPHCLDIAVSYGYGKMPQGMAKKDTPMVKRDSAPMEEKDIITNRNKIMERNKLHNTYDLKGALVNNLGVSEQVASDWVEIRHAAGVHETQTTYEVLAEEIQKCSSLRGVTADECVRYAILRGWKTISAGFEWPVAPNDIPQGLKTQIITL